MPAIGEIGGGIQVLPPGSHLRIDSKGNRELRRWWSVGKKSDRSVPRNIDEARREVRYLVESSVGEHLLSDVPVAFFLSGGIDSSIVALATAKGRGRPPSTFCIGFPNVGLDERKLARLVAERAGSEHFEIEGGPDECLAWMVEAVGAMDAPSADAINTYIVSKAVRSAGFGCPVICSNLTSLPEVAGRAAILIPAVDPIICADAVRRLEVHVIRKKFIDKGFENLKRFDLDNMIDAYEKIYKKALIR
jgi:asparagine synthetase B (glutamine-hydrolysing)